MTEGLDSVWSVNPHLVVRLRELVRQGKSGGEIAKTLKISRNAVIGKLDRLGLKLGGARRRSSIGVRVRYAQVDLQNFARPSSPRRFSWQDATDGV